MVVAVTCINLRSRASAVLFFLSSRRRHTRLQGDWSSDVCSSDLNTRACPECGGTRLRREARHVRILDKTLFEVSGWPLRKTLDFYKNLKLDGDRKSVV